MTIRDKLTRARRKAGIAAIIGWFVCLIGMVLTVFRGQLFLLVFIPGAIVFAAGVLYALLGMRCPQCGGRLGWAIAYPTRSFFKMPDTIKFCPFCGVELDSELPPEQGTSGR